ncbi:MAG: hypothetical protein ABI887_16255, partial [Burkholderiales bacterium]
FNDRDVAAARARLEKVVPKQKYSRVEFLQMITVDVLAALDRGVELGQIEPELKKLNIEIPASFIAKARSMRKARALGPKRADAS